VLTRATSRPGAARALAHAASRRVYRAAFGPVGDDPARQWRSITPDGMPTLRLLYVGDCGFRDMEQAHDLRAPIGFPKTVAETLVDNGIGLEFAYYFAVLFEHLPDMELLERRNRLTGDPDVIAIQLGASYARRVIIPDTQRMQQLRDDVKRRLGRAVWPGYKLLRPWVRAFGHFQTSYHGPGALERFLHQVRAAYPDAEVVLMPPFPRSFTYPEARPVVEQVDADVREVARRCGTPLVDFDDVLGGDPALRCVAGYNLNARGSQLVGEKLADWLLEHAPIAGPVADDRRFTRSRAARAAQPGG
jgi:GDSL-like Lipase/Acylhydrolase family